MTRPKFTISILSMFDLPKVMRCISSVMAGSRDYNLILTDNGAEGGIPQYFDALTNQHKFIKVTHNPRNLGFQFPNKLALAQCTTPYFVMLNDDTEVPVGWLNRIEETFKANPRAALVGPMQSPCSLHANFAGYAGNAVEYIEGSCCACKTEVVNKLGLFSDYLTGAYMEDIDLSLRAREAGFSIHLAPFQIVHHGSQTAKRLPEVGQWIEHNSIAMQKRWSGWNPGHRFDGERELRMTLVYIHVPGNRHLELDAAAFVDSYLKNLPGISHETLVVVNATKPGHHNPRLFDRLPGVKVISHNNDGWDIGGYLAAAKQLVETTDLMICCGSQTTFPKPGWLLRLLEAWSKHGAGVYGTCATYQIRPHLNTSGFVCSPSMLLRYDGCVNSKRDRYQFEHGENAFWIQMARAGYPVKLVTHDGEYDWPDWRKPENIYCRGDQSNCLIWFRMNREFEKMSSGQRQTMSNMSDKLTDPVFVKQLCDEVGV